MYDVIIHKLEIFHEGRVVDLRYRMTDILKALARNEEVTILYHGKVKGIIISIPKKETKKISAHPFFGMYREDTHKSVFETLDDLRKTRYDDI